MNMTPDFENNLRKVLQGGQPKRATLFELLISETHLEALAGHKAEGNDLLSRLRLRVEAMAAGGYDYAMTHASPFRFVKVPRHKKQSASLNDGAVITDRASFESFDWPDPTDFDTSHLEKIRPCLPEGMKLMVMGPDGVLETVIRLMGYDNLCLLLYDDPALVEAVFEEVGSRFVKYYELAAEHDTVGILCSNDDWGFHSQTFLSTEDMRRLVFPWHKKIVQVAHRHGLPCILHSCGNYTKVIEDVINDMGYDARHSYEDKIVPVERAYEELHGRIAVLGGIDVHFLTTKTPEEVYTRARNMLLQVGDRGGYALGSGNSIAPYVPVRNYLALLQAAKDTN